MITVETRDGALGSTVIEITGASSQDEAYRVLAKVRGHSSDEWLRRHAVVMSTIERGAKKFKFAF